MVISFNSALARPLSNGYDSGVADERGRDVSPNLVGAASPAMRGLADTFSQGESDPGRVRLAALGMAAGMAMRAPQFNPQDGGANDGAARLTPASFPGIRTADARGADAAAPAAPGRDLRRRAFSKTRQRKLRRAQRQNKTQRARRAQARNATRTQSARRSQDTRRARSATPVNGTQRGSLAHARQRAQALGLRVTSTTGGRHAAHSYHYRGRAIDVSGSPAAMRQFYREMQQTRPTELFYDPMGGMKNGRNIGAIGGHGNHVHIAY